MKYGAKALPTGRFCVSAVSRDGHGTKVQGITDATSLDNSQATQRTAYSTCQLLDHDHLFGFIEVNNLLTDALDGATGRWRSGLNSVQQ